MKTRIGAILCVAGLLPVLGGCSNPLNLKTILLDARDNGTTVQAKTGDRLIVLLRANPSTGFDWQATISDTDALTQAQEKFVPDNAGSSDNTVGEGGTDVFEFDAAAPGTTTLTLELRQAGQPSTTPASSTFSITVQVSG